MDTLYRRDGQTLPADQIPPTAADVAAFVQQFADASAQGIDIDLPSASCVADLAGDGRVTVEITVDVPEVDQRAVELLHREFAAFCRTRGHQEWRTDTHWHQHPDTRDIRWVVDLTTLLSNR